MSEHDAENPEVFHETVYFSGRVQGVGFRYQVLQIAKGFEVAGYVQNLPDGRVILEAEGTRDEVSAFIAEVEEEMSGFIKNVEKRGAPRKQEFFGFTIR